MSLFPDPSYTTWPTHIGQIRPFTTPYVDPLEEARIRMDDILRLKNAINPNADVNPKFELKNGNYELALVLPGYSKSDIKVSISENKLMVKGENGGLDGKGSIISTTAVPTKANAGAIAVSLELGILRITMPEITPTVINVQIP